jgi:hypothetical protein
VHVPATYHDKLNDRKSYQSPDHQRVGDPPGFLLLEDNPYNKRDQTEDYREYPVEFWACMSMLSMGVMLVAWVVSVC